MLSKKKTNTKESGQDDVELEDFVMESVSEDSEAGNTADGGAPGVTSKKKSKLGKIFW